MSIETGAGNVTKEEVKRCYFETIEIIFDLVDDFGHDVGQALQAVSAPVAATGVLTNNIPLALAGVAANPLGKYAVASANERRDEKAKDGTFANIKIYPQEDGEPEINQLYFLSDEAGKTIRINAERKGESDCSKPDSHSKIIFKDEQVNNSGSIERNIKYYGINLNPATRFVKGIASDMFDNEAPYRAALNDDMKKAIDGCHFWDYWKLPLDLSPKDKQYKEEMITFNSCPNKKKEVKIIVYPEIKYTAEFSFGSDSDYAENDDFDDEGEGFSFYVEYGGRVEKISFYDDENYLINSLIELVKKIKLLSKPKAFLEKTLKFGKNETTGTYWDFYLETPTMNLTYEREYYTDHINICKYETLKLEFDPLIGGKFVLHLIPIALNALSAGSLTPVITLAKKAMNFLGADIYLDLEISGVFKGAGKLEACKLDEEKNFSSIELHFVFTIELKAGATIKGSIVAVKLEASGKASLSIGIIISKRVLFPITLEPCKITVVAQMKVQIWKLKTKFGSEKVLYESNKIEWENNTDISIF